LRPSVFAVNNFNHSEGEEKQKNRLMTVYDVENIGFEPMTSSMPWKRSSQLS
jgi:hypothetical protein